MEADLHQTKGEQTYMVILAVDLGQVRTGIAICDAGEILASPLTVLRQPNRPLLADQIAELAKERNAQLLVLGHPLNMDGSAGSSALGAEAFARLLQERSGLPVILRDERGTTVTAHRYLNDTDTRGKKRKAVVDAVAAVIILQDYLEYRRIHKQGGESE